MFVYYKEDSNNEYNTEIYNNVVSLGKYSLSPLSFLSFYVYFYLRCIEILSVFGKFSGFLESSLLHFRGV